MPWNGIHGEKERNEKQRIEQKNKASINYVHIKR